MIKKITSFLTINFLLNVFTSKVGIFFAVIIINTFPISGYYLLNWDYRTIIMIYWIENVLLLIFGYLKARTYKGMKEYSKKIKDITPIFIVFMFFNLGHLLLLLSILSGFFPDEKNITFTFLTDNIANISFSIVMILLVAILNYRFFTSNNLQKKQHIDYNFPILRILLFHFVVVIGAFLIAMLPDYKEIVFVLFLSMKVFMDAAEMSWIRNRIVYR